MNVVGRHTVRPAFRLRVSASPIRLGVGRYIAVVAIGGVASLFLPPSWTIESSRWLPAVVVLTLLSAGLEFVNVELPRAGHLSVATISHVATILLVPPPFSALSVALAVLLEQVWRHRASHKIVFNSTNYLVSVSLASLLVGLLGNPWVAVTSGAYVVAFAMFAAAAATYYVANDLLTSGVIALVTGHPLASVLRSNARNTLSAEAGAAALGALLAVMWIVAPAWTLMLAVPAIVISRALRYIRQLETETRAAVRGLAETIDSRDANTYHHSERVAGYAVLLAEELGLPTPVTELIAQAAEVHDLGKIGVPDAVLLKAGALTDAERAAMSLHTEVGAKVLSRFELFRPGAAIVRHHHENYDGSGYPDGLRGDDIPIGARVVAVADAFDAMTSDRPYRRALPQDEAVRRLRDGAGRQWDPVVVGVFLRLIDTGQLAVREAR